MHRIEVMVYFDYSMATFSLTFLKKEKVSADAYSFFFDRKETQFSFLPGQYIRMTLDIKNPDERGNPRFFTIASSPTEEDYVMITTRVIKSAFKKTLLDLVPGTKVKLDGPFGNFVLNEEDKNPRIFLAGGIGITPFRSMVVYAHDKKLAIPMTLFASSSRTDDTVYFDELKKVEEELLDFRYIVTVTKPEESKIKWNGETGRIDEEKLRKYTDNVSEPVYYISGPNAFVTAMHELVKGLGVDPQKIKTEVFPGY